MTTFAVITRANTTNTRYRKLQHTRLIRKLFILLESRAIRRDLKPFLTFQHFHITHLLRIWHNRERKARNDRLRSPKLYLERSVSGAELRIVLWRSDSRLPMVTGAAVRTAILFLSQRWNSIRICMYIHHWLSDKSDRYTCDFCLQLTSPRQPALKTGECSLRAV